MKKLIISCDDLGISKEINLGIKDCLEKGVATSSSLIANGQFYNHALENVINKTPQNYYGLHLNLTEGEALNKIGENFICDDNNFFKISAKKYFLLNFYKKKKDFKNIIYNELKSQIEKVLQDGVKISHFDSHQHIHHSPWIFKIITDLAKEFKINKIRFVNEKIIFKNYFKDIVYKLKSLNYLKYLIINFCNNQINNSLKSPDYFFGILNSGKIQEDEFFYYVQNIEPNKIIEFCVHPSNELENKFTNQKNLNNKNFYLSKNRFYEKNFLFSDSFNQFIKKENIKLVNFSELV